MIGAVAVMVALIATSKLAAPSVALVGVVRIAMSPAVAMSAPPSLVGVRTAPSRSGVRGARDHSGAKGEVGNLTAVAVGQPASSSPGNDALTSLRAATGLSLSVIAAVRWRKRVATAPRRAAAGASSAGRRSAKPRVRLPGQEIPAPDRRQGEADALRVIVPVPRDRLAHGRAALAVVAASPHG